RLTDEGAVPVPDLHDAQRLERPDRLPDTVAAGPEQFHELRLGGHGGAGVEVTLMDQGDDAVLDRLAATFSHAVPPTTPIGAVTSHVTVVAGECTPKRAGRRGYAPGT